MEMTFEVKKLTNMRKLIAKAMHTSLQNSAQLTHHMSADARTIMALRKKYKKALDAGQICAEHHHQRFGLFRGD